MALKISPTIILLLSCDCPCYNHLSCELFQATWLARMPKRLFAASDNCFKRQKAPNVKVQGTGGPQFDCPKAVSQNVDVNNIKYKIMLNKI